MCLNVFLSIIKLKKKFGHTVGHVGILVSPPRIEPMQWKCRVLTTGSLGKSLIYYFEICDYFYYH